MPQPNSPVPASHRLLHECGHYNFITCARRAGRPLRLRHSFEGTSRAERRAENTQNTRHMLFVEYMSFCSDFFLALP